MITIITPEQFKTWGNEYMGLKRAEKPVTARKREVGEDWHVCYCDPLWPPLYPTAASNTYPGAGHLPPTPPICKKEGVHTRASAVPSKTVWVLFLGMLESSYFRFRLSCFGRFFSEFFKIMEGNILRGGYLRKVQKVLTGKLWSFSKFFRKLED